MAQPYSPKIFIATAELQDEEMAERARLHRSERGQEWTTIEEPIEIGRVLMETTSGIVVLDCLTLWIANLLQQELDVTRFVNDFLEILTGRRAPLLIVTNEVGSGIVPDNVLARNFRDIAGFLNQQVANLADEVVLMVCGYPIVLKESQ
jgi:adenosylcobinamide kinase / adenosylcobinamide-phosphate guanylyltransferase